MGAERAQRLLEPADAADGLARTGDCRGAAVGRDSEPMAFRRFGALSDVARGLSLAEPFPLPRELAWLGAAFLAFASLQALLFNVGAIVARPSRTQAEAVVICLKREQARRIVSRQRRSLVTVRSPSRSWMKVRGNVTGPPTATPTHKTTTAKIMRTGLFR